MDMQEAVEFEDPGDFIAFASAGTSAKGQYRCAECGYGITIHDALPTCPMCSGTEWEPSAWSPFSGVRSRMLSGSGATRQA